MSNDERMTKPEYTMPTTRPRDSVLACGSPLSFLRPRFRLNSAGGLAQSASWQQANRFVESFDTSFSAHCDHKPGRAVSGGEAENDARTIAAFYFRRDSVFRHSDFLRHSSFDIRHCFVLRHSSFGFLQRPRVR